MREKAPLISTGEYSMYCGRLSRMTAHGCVCICKYCGDRLLFCCCCFYVCSLTVCLLAFVRSTRTMCTTLNVLCSRSREFSQRWRIQSIKTFRWQRLTLLQKAFLESESSLLKLLSLLLFLLFCCCCYYHSLSVSLSMSLSFSHTHCHSLSFSLTHSLCCSLWSTFIGK